MEKIKKKLAIIGSTGSIGTQALDVVKAHPDIFEIELLAAHSNVDLLLKQAIEFNVNTVVVTDETRQPIIADKLWNKGIKCYSGTNALEQCVQQENIDMVLAAIVGYAGLSSTLAAIKAGKQIALANKETLVVAGDIVTKLAKENGVNIYPVDSEHSAIFQCLVGEFHNPIEKIYLTASGGPFRGMNRKDLEKVSVEQALKHPNWSMGAKITIDSASLMNKGLEVIEAKWLFGLKPEQIDVIIHAQSIIHSLVQFKDGSMKAQMGLPDMKLPIQYALGYPNRLPSEFKRFSFADYSTLSFESPDVSTFRNLALAFDSLRRGGNANCVLNAANEIAVQGFLTKKIKFTDMPQVIEHCLEKISFVKEPSYEDYVNTDKETRILAQELL